jgi:hypothetical protein
MIATQDNVISILSYKQYVANHPLVTTDTYRKCGFDMETIKHSRHSCKILADSSENVDERQLNKNFSSVL